MLKGYDIICFGGSDWNTPLWTNRQHIMSRLSKENRVLYIESIGIRMPNITKGTDLRKIFKRLKYLFHPMQERSENLYILTPFVLLAVNNCFFCMFNKAVLRACVNSARKKLNFTNPVLWTYLPHAVWLLGDVSYEAVLYHCVDEYKEVPGVASDQFAVLEAELLNKCDLVFTTSKKLYESKKAHNKNTYYLPNVADFAHFSMSRKGETKIPDDMVRVRKPVIGYIGNLCDHKVDMDLLDFSARSRQDVSFVLIGPVWEGNTEIHDKIERLKELNNVHFLGLKAYEDLPAYIKGFDVCIIPHKMTEYSKYSFPLKLNEFLASGKPVVSTELPSIEDYKDVVYMASSPRDFVDMLQKALSEDLPDKRKERIAAASKNTWEARIKTMEKIMFRELDIFKKRTM